MPETIARPDLGGRPTPTDPNVIAWWELCRMHDFQFQFAPELFARARGEAERKILLDEAARLDIEAVLAIVEWEAAQRLGPEEGPNYLERFAAELRGILRGPKGGPRAP